VVVAADAVTVRLGGRTVLDRASVRAHVGEVVALVGPNGAGKSTMLAVLAGDLRPDAGSVHVAGRPVGEWPARELARRRAVLPQRPSVAFGFTVRDVVRMGRAPWAGTDAEDRDDEAVQRALAAADVLALADRPVPTLSGGEAARAALARVLAQETPLVLLDEPTASLDLRHQEVVLATARRRADEGAAVVVVLHDLGQAAAHADRIAVVAAGRVVADGPPAEVLRPELLGAVYGHDVDVLEHPRTGALLVFPARPGPPVPGVPGAPTSRPFPHITEVHHG
jgi:iron complex transport system ATP-binding protein